MILDPIKLTTTVSHHAFLKMSRRAQDYWCTALYDIVLLFLNNILLTEVRSQCRYKVYRIVDSVTIATELEGRSLRVNRVVLKRPTGFLGHNTLLSNFHKFLNYNYLKGI